MRLWNFFTCLLKENYSSLESSEKLSRSSVIYTLSPSFLFECVGILLKTLANNSTAKQVYLL